LGRRPRCHGAHRCRGARLGRLGSAGGTLGQRSLRRRRGMFVADRELDGRAGELVRFGLLWVWGAMLFAAPPDRISLAGAAAFSWGTGGNLVPAGGFRAFLDRLSTRLDVRLATVVTAVEHGAAGVVVDSRQRDLRGRSGGGDGAPWRAEDRSAQLRPSAGRRSPRVRGAAGDGTLEKIALRFPERFWAESIRQITHVSDDRAFPDWVDFSRHTGSPTLVAFHNPSVTPGLAPSFQPSSGCCWPVRRRCRSTTGRCTPRSARASGRRATHWGGSPSGSPSARFPRTGRELEPTAVECWPGGPPLTGLDTRPFATAFVFLLLARSRSGL
jgi:hypothetical protein